MKKIKILLGITLAIIFSASCSSNQKEIWNIPVEKSVFNEEKAVKDSGSKEFKATSAIDTVKDMKTGWNLGNTLEATASRSLDSETSWAQPKTRKVMFDKLAEAGFKTVRIPVSWTNHIIDDNYTIDPAWMSRVKEVVDWAIEDGLYVIKYFSEKKANLSI